MLNKCGVFILFIAGMFAMIYGDTFEECEGIEQKYVELQEDCSFYIFCLGDESFSDSCPDDNPYFSVEDQTCETNRAVCKDRPVLKEPEIEEEQTSTLAATSIAVLTNSSSSVSTTLATFASINGSTSSPATITLPTTAAAAIPSIPTAPPTAPIPSDCPIVDNRNKVVFLPHAKSCSEYFLCYQGKRLNLRCSNLLHFDVRKQKCDYPENVKCQMMDVASPREQCLAYTFDFYPHPGNCNYYYECILGYLKVMQCPLNMGWHYVKRACVKRSQANCYNTISRRLN